LGPMGQPRQLERTNTFADGRPISFQNRLDSAIERRKQYLNWTKFFPMRPANGELS
jgi:hypothetical protein